MQRAHTSAWGDGGQVAPLLAAVVFVAVVAVVLVAQVGRVAGDRTRARTAADAAALAGALDGRAAAERLAADNGGTIEHFAVSAGDTEVTVRVGGARATARARAGRAGPAGVGVDPDGPP